MAMVVVGTVVVVIVVMVTVVAVTVLEEAVVVPLLVGWAMLPVEVVMGATLNPYSWTRSSFPMDDEPTFIVVTTRSLKLSPLLPPHPKRKRATSSRKAKAVRPRPQKGMSEAKGKPHLARHRELGTVGSQVCYQGTAIHTVRCVVPLHLEMAPVDHCSIVSIKATHLDLDLWTLLDHHR